MLVAAICSLIIHQSHDWFFLGSVPVGPASPVRAPCYGGALLACGIVLHVNIGQLGGLFVGCRCLLCITVVTCIRMGAWGRVYTCARRLTSCFGGRFYGRIDANPALL